jgi:hypothetical protein
VGIAGSLFTASVLATQGFLADGYGAIIVDGRRFLANPIHSYNAKYFQSASPPTPLALRRLAPKFKGCQFRPEVGLLKMYLACLTAP